MCSPRVAASISSHPEIAIHSSERDSFLCVGHIRHLLAFMKNVKRQYTNLSQRSVEFVLWIKPAVPFVFANSVLNCSHPLCLSCFALDLSVIALL